MSRQPPKKLTPDQITESVVAYESGDSIGMIAGRYHITRQAMWDLLRRRTQLRPFPRSGADNRFYRGGSTASDLAHGKVAPAIESGLLVPGQTIKPCRQCGDMVKLTDYQVGRHSYLCALCDRAYKSKWKAEKSAIARSFINEVNARTFCAHCGKQPIEWHNPEHVELGRRTFRIGNMVSYGYSLATIEAELKRCTPLCRGCHQRVDGRMDALIKRALDRIQPPKPCEECSRLYKPLRRGLCSKCDARRRRAS